MTDSAIVDTSLLRGRRGLRATAKGRPVDPAALADVQALLGDAPRRRDLLIEHLHRIQDHFGHLSAAHLSALAQEMRLAALELAGTSKPAPQAVGRGQRHGGRLTIHRPIIPWARSGDHAT